MAMLNAGHLTVLDKSGDPAGPLPGCEVNEVVLKDAERGAVSWPAAQPPPRRKHRFFVGGPCGTCLVQFCCAVPLAAIGWVLGGACLLLALALVAVVYVILGCPLWSFWGVTLSWRMQPWNWVTDLYVKTVYLAYQHLLIAWPLNPAEVTPEFMAVGGIRPKEKLRKTFLDFALNIQVPIRLDEEHFIPALNKTGNVFSRFAEEHLCLLPQQDSFEEFADGENPVEYMMRQVGHLYPSIYQVWEDKLSDEALTRFCLYGLAAHRVETEFRDGKKFYVVRTNQISDIPVRAGFERYGGDAYFDENWRVVKIVDRGLLQNKEDGQPNAVTTYPGDAAWPRSKFRFRSSASVLVTLVDHLYNVHFEIANCMVTAVREQLSSEHPMRRFMTPFVFQTITINDKARQNIVQPRSMGQRCFAMTDRGFQMAFAAAPKLLRGGLEVPKEEGGPIYNRVKYYEYLRDKHGIDTEYHRQSVRIWNILRTFLTDYLDYYFPTHADVVNDKELRMMLSQFFYQLEYVDFASSVLASSKDLDFQAEPKDVEVVYEYIVDSLTNFLFAVTADHEQVGAIEAYIQDVSFCAFKWTPGASRGTKQTATTQGLLMSFTSTPMPKLIRRRFGDRESQDWLFLFPEAKEGAATGARSPQESFEKFQTALIAMAEDCEAFNDAAATRAFPHCFPMYTCDPGVLETSISV